MYKIQHFARKFCEGNSKCLSACDVYSIWRFHPWERWQPLREFLFPTDVFPCPPEWFALIYWLSLCISVLGIFYSISELILMYYGSWKMSTFRERTFQILPPVFLRNARLVGAVFMVRMWASLFIGIATVTPWMISLWLTIYFAIFCLELILWIGEILFGVIKLDVNSICSHFISLGTFLLVRCVRDVFIRVIERHGNMEELQLLM